jgi:hypothetical protein
MVVHTVDLIRSRNGPLMPRVPRLASRGAPAWSAYRAWRCRWQVRRGRFGRVLGMLIQADVQIGHLLSELGNLPLLLGNKRQQGEIGAPHEG